jgi:hypothetical protein
MEYYIIILGYRIYNTISRPLTTSRMLIEAYKIEKL